MKQRLCYIISHVQKSFAFEWTAIRLKDKYDLTFILLNPGDSALEQFLKINNIHVVRIAFSGKSDMVSALWKTWRILRDLKPGIVHAHLLDAQLVGLTAARFAGVKKRIYTRHNSNFHHAYHPRGVRYDQWSNNMSTHIVSISQATDHTLTTLENVDSKKLRKIPHGFDFDALTNISADRVNQVRRKWNIPVDSTVVGVVARHIEWKGIQYIIPAFRKLLASDPTAVLVLANATGPYHKAITDSLKDISHSVIQVPFEEDIAALYNTFTIYIHTPVDPIVEAFGQTYVEALAAGVPSVFTLSGIAAEFIEDGDNALVAGFRDSDAIGVEMDQMLRNEQLRNRLRKKGREDVFSRFGIGKMIELLQELYDE